jgi:hypothetical protein
MFLKNNVVIVLEISYTTELPYYLAIGSFAREASIIC